MTRRAHPNRVLPRVAALGLVAAALAACGGSGGGSVSVPPPPAPVRLEDTFGTVFGMDYRAGANTEAAAVKTGDIIAVSLTAEPAALH